MEGNRFEDSLSSRLVRDYSEIDMLAPHDKYHLLVNDSNGLAQTAATALVALSCVDTVFRHEFDYDSIYVLDEGKFRRAYPRLDAVDEEIFQAALVALFLGQLIYKFTAALRFDVDDKRIKQVRINSWGRAACSENRLMAAPQGLSLELKAETEMLVDAHRDTYLRIVQLLRTKVTDEQTAHELAALNASVPMSIAQ